MDNRVFVIFGHCDDSDDFIAGVASSQERAEAMEARLKETFEEAFQYEIVAVELDTLILNEDTVRF